MAAMADDDMLMNPSTRISTPSNVPNTNSNTDREELIKQDIRDIAVMRESFKKGPNDHIRMANFIGLMMTVYIGGLQFGVIISMWNVAWKPFAWANGKTDNIEGEEHKESYQWNVTV